MTKTAVVLIAAFLLSHSPTEAQATKKTTRPPAPVAKTPTEKNDVPTDRPLHSPDELNTLAWWKMFGYLGGDAKTVYDATKSPNLKVDGYGNWDYTFPFGLTPPPAGTEIKFVFSVSLQHKVVAGPGGISWDEGLGGGGFDETSFALSLWGKGGKVYVGNWTHPKPPALYAAEAAMLSTKAETPTKAAEQIQLYYPETIDTLSNETFMGSDERTNVPYGDTMLLAKDLGNGYTIIFFCAARPGNTMGKYSSSYDPSTRNPQSPRRGHHSTGNTS